MELGCAGLELQHVQSLDTTWRRLIWTSTGERAATVMTFLSHTLSNVGRSAEVCRKDPKKIHV